MPASRASAAMGPQTVVGATTTTSSVSESSSELVGDSIDHQQIAKTKPVPIFRPFQNLMETELTLQFGKKLRNKKIIHQEMLCCYSEHFARVCNEARPLRASYDASDALRRHLKEFIPPRVSEKKFDDENLEEKSHPLKSYQKSIQQCMDDAVITEVGKKHVVGAGSNRITTKRDVVGLDIDSRLQALQAKGVFAVAQSVAGILRQIKYQEHDAATTNLKKATAQRRIILPDTTEDRVVRSVVLWLYSHGMLNYDDSEHLYAIYVLAMTMGISQLAETCLSKLACDATDAIEEEMQNGRSLRQLLEDNRNPSAANSHSSGSSKNTVQVVFDHVLDDSNPPQRLVELVIGTLADHLDVSLWSTLGPRFNLSLSQKLIKVIAERRQVKIELRHNRQARSESLSRGDGEASITFKA
ncbi:hypothetical protein ACEQ8H_004998 [Pleosporales sp. CAS-2024a]